jgi:hypothetical protein
MYLGWQASRIPDMRLANPQPVADLAAHGPHMGQLANLWHVSGVSAHGPPMDHVTHVTATPGLQNNMGQNLCFLNVMVQSLWHCRFFRRLVMENAPALEASGKLLRALVGVFCKFEVAEAREADAAGAAANGTGDNGRPRQVVTATELSDALSSLDNAHIRAGEILWGCIFTLGCYINLFVIFIVDCIPYISIVQGLFFIIDRRITIITISTELSIASTVDGMM